MKRTEIKDILSGSKLNEEVTICGWVRTSRESKTMAFAEVGDGSAFSPVQIVIDKAHMPDIIDILKVGAAIRVKGTVVKSEIKEGYEINAAEITLLGESPSDYPLQKKRHTLEFLRTMPHLRLRTNTFNAVFRVRSKISYAVHDYFRKNGYIYVHTPIITSSDCEGAGEIFRVTTLPPGYEAPEGEDYYKEDFFGKKAGLTVSGQLEGEAAALAFGKIYTFGPTFRAENSNTPRHAAEFWQIEPEVAFAELPDIIEIAEDMIKSLINYALENCRPELEFFEKHYESGLISKLEKVVSESFAVVDYTEAIELLKKADAEFKYPVEWGLDLQTEHERYIAETICNRPVFVTNYPKHIKSFYMKQNDDGRTVAATDLLVPGVGEIIGCSERENDYDKLLSAIRAKGMNEEDYKSYLELRKFGSAPHSGFGLGLERFLMYITGVSNIRDVQLYPRTPKEIRI
ncbi:MAG: asparagine--tRNA ligase [Clostridiales bacterium]|nr:asparagine--tRNA ligase [Clostridiales bacterium]